MLVKLYGAETSGQGHERKYSPSECVGARKDTITGNPDPRHVSTSYTERANLTMRMSMRWFTRLTNGFSKKLQNHEYMVALYAIWYNFVRIDKTLRTSPAMAAGIESRLWSMEDVVALIDARSAKVSGETLIGGYANLRSNRTASFWLRNRRSKAMPGNPVAAILNSMR
jgi:hypothetical protein